MCFSSPKAQPNPYHRPVYTAPVTSAAVTKDTGDGPLEAPSVGTPGAPAPTAPTVAQTTGLNIRGMI